METAEGVEKKKRREQAVAVTEHLNQMMMQGISLLTYNCKGVFCLEDRGSRQWPRLSCRFEHAKE